MAEAQNFRVSVKNYTGKDFYPEKEVMEFGGVYEIANIGKKTTTTTVFYTRGNRDAAAGTEGSLTYKTKEGEASITFKWDIPWSLFAEEKLDVTVTGPIRLEKSSWRGKDELLRKNVEIIIKDDLPLL